jgi:hypothetical protein
MGRLKVGRRIDVLLYTAVLRGIVKLVILECVFTFYSRTVRDKSETSHNLRLRHGRALR